MTPETYRTRARSQMLHVVIIVFEINSKLLLLLLKRWTVCGYERNLGKSEIDTYFSGDVLEHVLGSRRIIGKFVLLRANQKTEICCSLAIDELLLFSRLKENLKLSMFRLSIYTIWTVNLEVGDGGILWVCCVLCYPPTPSNNYISKYVNFKDKLNFKSNRQQIHFSLTVAHIYMYKNKKSNHFLREKKTMGYHGQVR